MRVAYDYPDPATGTAAISVLDLRRGTNTLVVTPPGRGDDPVLSRDGRRIAYRSIEPGNYELLCRDLDTVLTDSIQLFRSPQPLYPTDWSPDGAHLLFDQSSAGKSDSWVLTLANPKEPVLFQPGASLAQFSPDGRFVVYVADGHGRKEVYVTSFRPSGTRSQISASGGSKPRWSGDGRHIFYLGSDLRLMEVPLRIDAGDEIQPGPPSPLFQTSLDYHDERMPYAPNLDGTAFLVAPYPRQQPVALSVITNWPALSTQTK
jgi:Tol biopolymer transport system component